MKVQTVPPSGWTKSAKLICKVFIILIHKIRKILWAFKQTNGKIDRILLIRRGMLGDLIMISPFVDELNNIYPDSHIDWMMKATFFELYRQDNRISNLYPFPDISDLLKRQTWLMIARVFLQYDIVYVLQPKLYYSFIANLLAPRKVIGFDNITGLNGYRQWDESLHDSNKYLSLINEKIRLSEIRYVLNTYDALFNEFEKTFLGNTYPIIIHMETGNTPHAYKRNWLISKFCTAIKSLLKKDGVAIGIVGSLAESNGFQHIDRVYDFRGKTSIPRLRALINKSALFIGNDSGPSHLAFSTNTPAIVIYGPVPPWKRISGRKNIYPISSVLQCSNCINTKRYKDCTDPLCLKDIKPESIIKTAYSILRSHK